MSRRAITRLTRSGVFKGHKKQLPCRTKSMRGLRLEVLESRCLLTAALEAPFGSEPENLAFIENVPGLAGSYGQPYFPYDDDEGDAADQPALIAGAFLTYAGGVDGDEMSFNDVVQGRSDTCSFASVLSAVALTDFDLEGGIIEGTTTAGVTTYGVRIYQPDAQDIWRPVWINVDFNGSLLAGDLRPGDAEEFWTALYLRAYLTSSQDLEANYRSLNHAFLSLTAGETELFDPGSSRADAVRIQTALNNGRPMAAGTIDDEPRILDGQAGIFHDHAYTLLGIEVPPSGTAGIHVTLRNPWGFDTSQSVFNTNGDGLDLGEYSEWTVGLDGDNDGIIRIPWAKFSTFFDHVAISDQTGPAINHPLSNFPPVFQRPTVLNYTAPEGTLLEVDFDAVDPESSTVIYSVADVYKVGDPAFNVRNLVGYEAPYIQLQSGQFRWEPLSDASGTYVISIAASTSPFDTATLALTVQVADGAPRIGSLTANPTSIKDDGSDLLTLTANNVVSDFDEVSHVQFYRDANGNGTFEEESDTYLFEDENGSNGWSWSGFVGGLTPGNQTFFARAGRLSFSDLHWSEPKAVTVTVTAAPIIQPAAIPLGNQQAVSSNASFDRFGFALTSDASGNSYAFWNESRVVSGTPHVDAYMRKYNAAGTALTGAVLLKTEARFEDIAMLADGHFAAVYNSSGLKVQWFTSSGALSGSPVTLTAASSGATTPRVASDSSGNLLIVYYTGQFDTADVYAMSVSAAGAITRAPWQVSTVLTGGQEFPDVALNDDGNGVVVWSDFGQRKIVARTVTNYGRSNGPEFTVLSTPGLPIFSPSQARVVIGPSGDFIIAWHNYGDNPADQFDVGVYARRYASNAQPKGEAFLVNSFRGGFQWYPEIAMNDAGWSVVAWESSATGASSKDVFAQLFNPEGNAVGPEFAVPSSLTLGQDLAGVQIDFDADPTFAWTDGATFDDPGFMSIAYRRFRVNLPPAFTGPTAFTLAENSLAAVVGSVAGNEPDPEDTLLYSLVGDGPFGINPVDGRITVLDPSRLDFEQTPQFGLTVRVQDNGNPALSATIQVSISLLDVNESPIIASTVISTREHLPAGRIIGTVSAVDPDAGDRLVFSLPNDTRFSINPVTGDLAVANSAALDFETAQQLVVAVRATDRAGLATTQNITINVQDDPFDQLVSGADAGAEARVRVLDAVTLEERFNFSAYPGFTGGVRVASGDINGDGTPDIITAAGPGAGPHVRVFDGRTGDQLPGDMGSFYAYHPNFSGGVFVASGDVNGDGRDDIITAAGAGGGPHVRVFSGIDAGELFGFFAYHPSFGGGVFVAAGDVNGDGNADIYTGAGAGGGPHVRVFSGATQAELYGFFAYHPAFGGGVRVAAGDLDGDGRDDIITAAGPGGGPHVRGLSGVTLADLTGFFAYDAAFAGGVFVAGAPRGSATAALRHTEPSVRHEGSIAGPASQTTAGPARGSGVPSDRNTGDRRDLLADPFPTEEFLIAGARSPAQAATRRDNVLSIVLDESDEEVDDVVLDQLVPPSEQLPRIELVDAALASWE